MKINSVSATALKGHTFSEKLGEMTVFAGTNNVGKTARADAIRLGLLGYLPEHGKTNVATMALASASKMDVELKIDGLPTVRREWALKGKQVKTATAGTDQLPETPLVLLNAAEYFSGSDAHRVQMLFDCLRLPAEKWTIDATRARIKKAGAGLEGFDTLAAAVKDETVQKWLDRMTEVFKAEAARLSDEVRRFEKTVQGITQLSLEETPVDAGTVAADLQAAEARLGELQGELGRLKGIVDQQGAGAEKRQEIREAIARLEAELGDRPLSTRPAAEVDAELAKLITRRAELAMAHRQALEQHEAALKNVQAGDALRKRLDAAKIVASKASAVEAELKSEQTALDALPEPADLEALQARIRDPTGRRAGLVAKTEALQKQLDEAREEFNKNVDLQQCPCCGLAGESWKQAVQRKLELKVAELGKEQRTVQDAFRIAGEDLDDANATLNKKQAAARTRLAAEKRVQGLRDAMAETKAAVDGLDGLKAQIEALGTAGAAPEPPAELATLDASLATLKDELRRLQVAAELAQNRRLLDAVPTVGGDDDEQRMADIEMQIEAQQDRIGELKEAQQRAANQAADAKRVTEANEAKAAALASADVVKALRNAVTKEREDLIKEGFGPLLATANTFTQDILPTPLEYRDGELGRLEGANWIPVRCFGGAHRAVTYAGIQAALGVQAPARLVIIDEMGIIHPDYKSLFLRNVRVAINDGKIEQFIGLDPRPDDYTPEIAEAYGLTLVTIAKK